MPYCAALLWPSLLENSEARFFLFEWYILIFRTIFEIKGDEFSMFVRVPPAPYGLSPIWTEIFFLILKI